MSNGSVLSQAEVDSIFKQATGKSISRSPAPQPAAPSAPPPQGAQPVAPSAPPPQTSAPVSSPEALQTLQTTVADLAQRMSKVETAISGLSQAEGGATDVGVTVQRLSQRLEAMMRDLRKVNSQVGGVLTGLEDTPDYGIRKGFICESCGSHSFVAIPMRCTKCGEGGGWGWWPQKE